jgi:putative hydrolase of the HAD superfamily
MARTRYTQLRVTRPDAVLFDALDTLLVRRPSLEEVVAKHGDRAALERAWAQAVARVPWPEAWDDAGRVARFWEQFYGELADGLAAGPEVTAELIRTQTGPDGLEPAPGAASTLEGLRREGYRLGVVANAEPWLRDVLTAAGLSSLVDTVVISAEVGIAKPDPAIFAFALEAVGVEPARALYVGDQPRVDGEGAAAAGIPFVLFDPHGEAAGWPGRRIDGLEELPALLT